MKELKLLFLLIISIQTAYSQISFPTSNAIWNVQSYGGNEIYYGLTGDTIINDTTYNKLYLLNDTTLNIDKNDIYIGGIRQKDQKVWLRLNINNHLVTLSRLNSDQCVSENSFESLLYDFSKNSGDTIWQDFYLQGTFMWVEKMKTASVISDVTTTNNQKTYHLNQYINIGSESATPFIPIMDSFDTWIEGIGSLKGLFWFLYDAPMSGGTSYRLNCFKQDNEVKYLDKNCTSCFKYSSTHIPDNNHSSISVLLNKSQLSIQGEASVFPCQIKLYNVLGQLRFSKTIYSDSESIYLPAESGNVYLYKLLKENAKVVIKTGSLIIN